MTFGHSDEKPGNYRHSVGMAKPLGYGSVEVVIDTIEAVNARNEEQKVTLATSIEKFVDKMNEWLMHRKLSFESTEQIKELKAMARQDLQPSSKWLRYPKPVGLFGKYKKAELVLPSYTQMLKKPLK
jgi:hypothetical protein